MDIHAGASTHSGPLSILRKIVPDCAVGKKVVSPVLSHAEHIPEPGSPGSHLEGAGEGSWVTITTPVKMLREKVRCFWSTGIFLVDLAGFHHFGSL